MVAPVKSRKSKNIGMMGIKRLTGFENNISEMQKFICDMDNDLLRQLALRAEVKGNDS